MITITISKKCATLIVSGILMLFAVTYFLPFSNILFSDLSFYNSNLGMIYCNDPTACRHEVAHMIDHDKNNISRTGDFSTTLLFHLVLDLKVNDQMDETSKIILGFPGVLSYNDMYHPYRTHAGSSPQEELYADIYKAFDGNLDKMPLGFKELYSDDPKYEEVYQYLLTHKVYFKQGEVMKEKLEELLEKAKENKELLIRIGLTLAGALAGAGATALVVHLQEQSLMEEIVMSVEE